MEVDTRSTPRASPEVSPEVDSEVYRRYDHTLPFNVVYDDNYRREGCLGEGKRVEYLPLKVMEKAVDLLEADARRGRDCNAITYGPASKDVVYYPTLIKRILNYFQTTDSPMNAENFASMLCRVIERNLPEAYQELLEWYLDLPEEVQRVCLPDQLYIRPAYHNELSFTLLRRVKEDLGVMDLGLEGRTPTYIVRQDEENYFGYRKAMHLLRFGSSQDLRELLGYLEWSQFSDCVAEACEEYYGISDLEQEEVKKSLRERLSA